MHLSHCISFLSADSRQPYPRRLHSILDAIPNAPAWPCFPPPPTSTPNTIIFSVPRPLTTPPESSPRSTAESGPTPTPHATYSQTNDDDRLVRLQQGLSDARPSLGACQTSASQSPIVNNKNRASEGDGRPGRCKELSKFSS